VCLFYQNAPKGVVEYERRVKEEGKRGEGMGNAMISSMYVNT
jgi:hypothetical protein